MTIAWVDEPPQTTLPEGFLYVGENTYYLGPRDAESARYLYSDSATSCIILIVEGRDHHNHPLIAFAHLSCEERFGAFVELVERRFYGPAALFALGANPPSAEASKHNCHMLMPWIQAHTPPGHAEIPGTTAWYVDQVTLALGFRVSEKERSGCVGIDVCTGIVSTQAYVLAHWQRDPTGGVQTLFSIFGLALNPPLKLHDVTKAFTPQEIGHLVRAAQATHWEQVARIDDRRLLSLFSSTPDDELPWFCENLRISAEYVRNYANSF